MRTTVQLLGGADTLASYPKNRTPCLLNRQPSMARTKAGAMQRRHLHSSRPSSETNGVDEDRLDESAPPAASPSKMASQSTSQTGQVYDDGTNTFFW